MKKIVVILAIISVITVSVLANHFEGCGVLVQGVECVLFQTDTGELYLLDNTGDF